MNSSLSVRRRQDISGTDIRPNSLRQKSPKARAMARPGESLFGSQTRATSGSSRRANTRPLHFCILSASAIWNEKIFMSKKLIYKRVKKIQSDNIKRKANFAFIIQDLKPMNTFQNDNPRSIQHINIYQLAISMTMPF